MIFISCEKFISFLKYLHFCPGFLVIEIKRLNKKSQLNFKNYDVTDWTVNNYNHIHKDSLEGSLVRVVFAAELVFHKILVPRLPQNTSNVNIEITGKSKQWYYLCH